MSTKTIEEFRKSVQDNLTEMGTVDSAPSAYLQECGSDFGFRWRGYPGPVYQSIVDAAVAFQHAATGAGLRVAGPRTPFRQVVLRGTHLHPYAVDYEELERVTQGTDKELVLAAKAYARVVNEAGSF